MVQPLGAYKQSCVSMHYSVNNTLPYAAKKKQKKTTLSFPSVHARASSPPFSLSGLPFQAEPRFCINKREKRPHAVLIASTP